MMIEHDHINAAPAQPRDAFDCGGTTIHSEQQGHGKFFEAVLHARPTETVAFVHPMRQIGVHLPAERGEDFDQQRGGGDAIDIVIAKDNHRLAAFARDVEAIYGEAHVRQQKGIGKILEPRLQEARDGFRLAEAAVEKTLGQERRKPEFLREEGGQSGLGRGDGPAVFHGS